MKKRLQYYMVFIFLLGTSICRAQDIEHQPEHTPEHEAAKQTETMQRQINLTPRQAKLIYQINLKYAHERQNCENRRENAMERMKNKNNDYKKVLTPTQYQELEKRRLGIYTQEKKSALDISYRTLHPTGKSEEDSTSAQFQEKPSSHRPASTNDSNMLMINEISTNPKLIPQRTEQ